MCVFSLQTVYLIQPSFHRAFDKACPAPKNKIFNSLIPRLHSPAFLTLCKKTSGVEPGNEAR